MDLDRLGLFRNISRRLDWLNQRQGVLAENIANSDTPHYKPSDVEPFEKVLGRSGDRKGQMSMAVTRVGHIAGTGDSGPARVAKLEDSFEVKPSGNAVNVEQQMMMVAETAMDHQLALNLYRKHVGMIRTAIGRGR
jgi:flagellar basal-body rod protein FlgB